MGLARGDARTGTVEHRRLGPIVSALYEYVAAGGDGPVRRSVPTALDGIPADCTDDVIVEHHLNETSPEVAVSIGLNRIGRAWCERDRRWPSISERLAFVDAYVRSDGPMAWLEFDGDGSGGTCAPPSLYVGVPADVGNGVVMKLIAGLSGDPGGTARIARRCLAAMPGGVHLLYLGAMERRGPPGIRLNVHAMDRRALIDYLERIGWPGSLEMVDDWLRRVRSRSGRFAAQVDLDARGVSARLGVEIARSTSLGATSPDEVGQTLCDFIEDGVCSTADLERLVTWTTPRRSGLDCIMSALLAPAHLVQAEAFERAYHHAKVVFAPDGTVRAKIYLVAYR